MIAFLRTAIALAALWLLLGLSDANGLQNLPAQEEPVAKVMFQGLDGLLPLKSGNLLAPPFPLPEMKAVGKAELPFLGEGEKSRMELLTLRQCLAKHLEYKPRILRKHCHPRLISRMDDPICIA